VNPEAARFEFLRLQLDDWNSQRTLAKNSPRLAGKLRSFVTNDLVHGNRIKTRFQKFPPVYRRRRSHWQRRLLRLGTPGLAPILCECEDGPQLPARIAGKKE